MGAKTARIDHLYEDPHVPGRRLPMRILLDESLPIELRDELPGHSVSSVREMGWPAPEMPVDARSTRWALRSLGRDTLEAVGGRKDGDTLVVAERVQVGIARDGLRSPKFAFTCLIASNGSTVRDAGIRRSA